MKSSVLKQTKTSTNLTKINSHDIDHIVCIIILNYYFFLINEKFNCETPELILNTQRASTTQLLFVFLNPCFKKNLKYYLIHCTF